MPAKPAGMNRRPSLFIIQMQFRSAEICPVSDPVHICHARTRVTNAQLGLMPGVELGGRKWLLSQMFCCAK